LEAKPTSCTAATGEPEEIVDRIRQLRNGGVAHILLSGTGNAPDLLRTFAEEIMPAFA
jgi:alkanesulfonate monooxygenase SsuD/methylene tetrahydromethanopterin reductase-like flavin-dependent oxidoreductase (luciferase family)